MNSTSSGGLLRFFLAWAVALPGCVAGASDSLDDESVDDSFVSFEDFKASLPRDPVTGAYLVEGDIRVYDAAQLETFYSSAPQPGALTVNVVNGVDDRWSDALKGKLTYCVSTDFGGDYDTVVRAMLTATNDWSNYAAVRFTYSPEHDGNCTSANNGVMFRVRPVAGTTYAALAFFPSAPPVYREVSLDLSNVAAAAPATLTGILRHEIGHVLGFRHEHIRSGAAGCPTENSNWRALTEYDAASIMHYPGYVLPACNGTNTGDLFLTSLDISGARALYGVTPPRLPYYESWGYSNLLGGWLDDGDLQFVGDFRGLGRAQVMFINRQQGGGKVQIVDYQGAAPGQSRYLESWGDSNQLAGWLDDGDLQLVGDFRGLGRDQVMFVNRQQGGGKIHIVDYQGAAPGQINYYESWGDSSMLGGWLDDGDVQLVGDFRGLGYDQVMFVNRQAGGGKVMIVDYKAAVPGQIRYVESWGGSSLLNGWLDDADRQVAGDFRGLGYDQVMFVNAQPGSGKVMMVDYKGAVPGQVPYWGEWTNSVWFDNGDWQIPGDFRGLGRDQVMFVNRQPGGGKIQLLDGR